MRRKIENPENPPEFAKPQTPDHRDLRFFAHFCENWTKLAASVPEVGVFFWKD
jgi:hypothetical protein